MGVGLSSVGTVGRMSSLLMLKSCNVQVLLDRLG